MINLFTVAGTGQTPTSTNNNFCAQVAAGVNKAKFKVIPVAYPAGVPFNTSSNTGTSDLKAAMAKNPGKSALLGYSQGAMVVSNILKLRPADVIAGVTFGNPMREAGHTFPGCPEPGGHGIMSPQYRLTGTPTWWWDFAAPNDLAACVGDTLTGKWMTTVFMAVCEQFSGNLPLLLLTLKGIPFSLIPTLAGLLPYVTPDLDKNFAHTSYAEYVPPVSGNTLTAVQLAINYLNGLPE